MCLVARPSSFALVPAPREGMRGPLWLTASEQASSFAPQKRREPRAQGRLRMPSDPDLWVWHQWPLAAAAMRFVGVATTS